MKMLARAHVYWPKINEHIEELIKGCSTCQITQNVPRNKDILEWENSSRTWERVHIDFLDICGVKILVLVDSYSKWVHAHVMHGSDCDKTVDKLFIPFSTLGFPQEIMADNGPPFNAIPFENFCKTHGIHLTHSPPYHAKSNGMAEKTVQTINNNIKKQLRECKARTSIERK